MRDLIDSQTRSFIIYKFQMDVISVLRKKVIRKHLKERYIRMRDITKKNVGKNYQVNISPDRFTLKLESYEIS